MDYQEAARPTSLRFRTLTELCCSHPLAETAHWPRRSLGKQVSRCCDRQSPQPIRQTRKSTFSGTVSSAIDQHTARNQAPVSGRGARNPARWDDISLIARQDTTASKLSCRKAILDFRCTKFQRTPRGRNSGAGFCSVPPPACLRLCRCQSRPRHARRRRTMRLRYRNRCRGCACLVPLPAPRYASYTSFNASARQHVNASVVTLWCGFQHLHPDEGAHSGLPLFWMRAPSRKVLTDKLPVRLRAMATHHRCPSAAHTTVPASPQK